MPSNKSAYSHLQRPLSTLVDLCVEAVLTQHRHAERFSALTTFLDGLPDPVDYNGLVLALCWYGDERIRTELLAVLEINKTARWVLKPFSDQEILELVKLGLQFAKHSKTDDLLLPTRDVNQAAILGGADEDSPGECPACSSRKRRRAYHGCEYTRENQIAVAKQKPQSEILHELGSLTDRIAILHEALSQRAEEQQLGSIRARNEAHSEAGFAETVSKKNGADWDSRW